MKQKNKQRDGFFSMLLGALSAILLQNMLIGTNFIRAGKYFWCHQIFLKFKDMTKANINFKKFIQ